MELYIFFCFFFMNLSWSHDLDGGFNILIWIDLSCFFIIFLIDFFSISSFNVGLVRNWLCNFFFIFFLWNYLDLITRVIGLAGYPGLNQVVLLIFFYFIF